MARNFGVQSSDMTSVRELLKAHGRRFLQGAGTEGEKPLEGSRLKRIGPVERVKP